MTYRERQRRRRRGLRRHGGGALTLLLFGAVFGIAGVIGLGWVAAIFATTPGPADQKARDAGQTSEIFAADGTRLGFVQSDAIRRPIRWTEMPEVVREATIAIEDENFYEHAGIDLEAIGRAGIANVASGGAVQGGSTITQQLARTLYINDPQRTIERKVREAKIALDLEAEHGKEWILRQYLNSIPYGTVNGRTAIGIEAAAEMFFAKRARDLDLAEAALLAGLPQAPSQYNPFQNPGAAKARRNEVLGAMVENGYISRQEATTASEEPLGARETNRFSTRREPYFFDYVQQLLIERYGVETLRQGGLKVYTTIDPDLQEAGRNAITGVLNVPGDPSSAVVAIDPSNGDIKTMASSGTYDERTFNLAAQGHRQPGSAFKTMVLAAAVREGIDPDSTYFTSKSPITLNVPGHGPWTVETYDNSSAGRISLTRATLRSDNSVYAQLIASLGPEKVVQTAKDLGITTKLEGYLAEGLGGLEIGVSPLEMANAYATIASGGVRNEPQAIERIEFPNGDVEELGEPERKRVMTDGEAYEIQQILKQNVTSGTGTRAQIGCTEGTAGKTGTTDNFNDAWFVGFTPSLSTAVWVGYPDAQQEMLSVHGVSVAGGTFPAEIWGNFMEVANTECSSFQTPSTPASLSAYSGEYSQEGSTDTTSTSTAPVETGPDAELGGGDTSDGGGGGGGTGGGGAPTYDPKFYEDQPQVTPKPGRGR